MKKKNLLLVTAISPFPQDSGGATRIRNTIKELSLSFNIFLVSFKNENYKLNNEEEKELSNWCKKIIFIPIKSNKIIGSYYDLGQPYWFSDWYSPELIPIIKSILKNQKIDKIQIEFSQLLYIIDYLDEKEQKRCVFTSHDISTISFFRRLIETKNIKRKIIHFLRFIEIYFYEKKYIPKYQIINTVSKNDSLLLKKYFKPKKIVVVPNGIEKIDFLENRGNSNDVVLGYIGSFLHSPNKTAFLYFIKKIAPKLEKEKINYKYILAGKNSDDEVKKLLSKTSINIKNKIINTGFVESPKDFFKQIDILITPIFAGSGSRIKILEALGFGKKIVSSKIGAEGIDIDTKLISICNNSQDYINEIKTFQKKEKTDYKKEKENISKLTWNYIFKNYYN